MPVSQVPFAGISNPVDFRNIVINGDMQIAQRATSVASITSGAYYTLDRWNTVLSSLGTWTMSQSTDVPSGYGFANSLKMDCTAADASPAASDNFRVQQLFEGQNLQYLKKGTANALPLTLSFWVKSTKTGTFIAEIFDTDNTRQVSKSYTVSVSNTWEFKTITFPADTTGTLNNDNGVSLSVTFWLGAGTDFTSGTLNTSWGTSVNANRAVGQVNIADSTANDWLITGVQLEAGEQASGFEFMPYSMNLNRCQRYCYLLTSVGGSGTYIRFATGENAGTTASNTPILFPVTMRANATLTTTGTASNYMLSTNGSGIAVTAIATQGNACTNQVHTIACDVASGLTSGGCSTLASNNNNTAYLLFTAEL